MELLVGRQPNEAYLAAMPGEQYALYFTISHKLKIMKKQTFLLLTLCLISVMTAELHSQSIIRVRPNVIDDVLVNPGIGFQTFQRFNGDELNEGVGWTEGFEIKYQEFDGNLEMEEHPMTTNAYFRVYWRYLEPEMGKYNWEMIDRALKTSHERGQTLALRVAPYGSGREPNDRTDVPSWYRAMVGDRNEWMPGGRDGWRVDPEDPRYAQYFGRAIAELGKRYDGHPDFEYVDMSIVGFWGEGRGSALLTQQTREALVNAYTDNFKKTILIINLDELTSTINYARSQANAGLRFDCVGDLGFRDRSEDQLGWNHMDDFYAQGIINFGMQDAWKTAPVSLEVCGTIKSWVGPRDECQHCQGYGEDELKYIFDETLKWRISSFNNKSSGVPDEYRPLVDEWLKRMGYRFVLRQFSYPEFAAQGEKVSFLSWWDNKGVAPIYKKNFQLAFRLANEKGSHIFFTDADINSWMPGDNLYDDAIFIPWDMPAGNYRLQVGIVDRQTREPGVNLAIEGRDSEGWYSLGKLEIKETNL